MALKLIPNLFQSAGNSSTPRCGPRVTPDPLLTIRLPEGNQGIVLDLSEEGLGFLAAAPIDNGRSIRFVLADRSNRRSEATGELMWKDSAGKRGGLRFTEVSSELRQLIQSYLGQEDSTAVGAKDPLPAGFEIPDSFASQAHAGILPDVKPQKPRNWNFAANATTVVAASLVAAAIWYNIDGQRKLPSFDNIKQHVTKFIFTKINHVPTGWTAKLDLHTRQTEKSVAPALKSSPAAEANAQTATAAPAEPSNAEPSALPVSETPQSAASSSTAEPTTPQPTIPAIAVIPAKTVTAPPPPAEAPSNVKISPAKIAVKPEITAKLPETSLASAPADDSDDSVATARKLLTNQSDAANQSRGIQMLWQAVAKGNPAAEVELAGLYLSGTGVSKSCSQAVVLLKAAQSRKSTTAQEKLAQLPQFGCASEDSPASLKPAVDSNR